MRFDELRPVFFFHSLTCSALVEVHERAGQAIGCVCAKDIVVQFS